MVARADQATDPQVVADLATVRLGTAFFRRALNQVSDAGLDASSLLPGWDRRHLTAHVGYNARALARLVVWADTGVVTPMYESTQARAEEIELGATLPPEALRNLVEHSAIDLDVRWRDLPDDRWTAEVKTAQGRTVPVSETVWMRSREVWLHAVDLAAGARLEQIPAAVLRRLVDDVHRTWAARGEQPLPALVSTDSEDPVGDSTWGEPSTGLTVSGPLPALAGWVTGRLAESDRAIALDWSGGGPVAAPRWV